MQGSCWQSPKRLKRSWCVPGGTRVLIIEATFLNFSSCTLHLSHRCECRSRLHQQICHKLHESLCPDTLKLFPWDAQFHPRRILQSALGSSWLEVGNRRNPVLQGNSSTPTAQPGTCRQLILLERTVLQVHFVERSLLEMARKSPLGAAPRRVSELNCARERHGLTIWWTQYATSDLEP